MASAVDASSFRLWPVADGRGISCDGKGAFIGTIPLLQRQQHPSRGEIWAPRPAPELNAALTARYGVPIDMTAKLDGLANVANDLNRGDIFRAQLGTLGLRLPDPPPSAGALPFGGHIAKLAMLLHASGMLDRSGGSRLGSPANSNLPSGAPALPVPANQNIDPRQAGLDMPLRGRGGLPVTPVQEMLPSIDMPLDIPFARPLVIPKMPGEIAPLPFNFPGLQNTPLPVGNPFPNNAECVKEWAEAMTYCWEQFLNGNFESGYSGPGSDLHKCLMGQVSEACGGNTVA